MPHAYWKEMRQGDCEVVRHRDDTVFAGGGLSLVKVQLQFQEGVAKVCSQH